MAGVVTPHANVGCGLTEAWYTLPSVSLASRASDNELKLAMKAQNLRYGKFANIAKLEFETCVSLPSGEIIKRPPYPFGAPAQRLQGGEAGAGTLERCWLWQDSGAADNYRVGVVIGYGLREGDYQPEKLR